MTNTAGAALLGQKDENQKRKLPPLRTAFVVFQDTDGQWAATNDPNMLADDVEIEKLAHPDEIAAATASIQGDVIAQKAAAMVQSVMMAAAEQAKNAAIARQAGLL